MNKIFEVRSISRSEEKAYDWGARKSYSEAEILLETRKKQLHSRQKDWWIEKIDTTGCFQIPSSTMPRDIYSVREQTVETKGGYGNTLNIEVLNANFWFIQEVSQKEA